MDNRRQSIKRTRHSLGGGNSVILSDDDLQSSYTNLQ